MDTLTRDSLAEASRVGTGVLAEAESDNERKSSVLLGDSQGFEAFAGDDWDEDEDEDFDDDEDEEFFDDDEEDDEFDDDDEEEEADDDEE